MESTKRLLFRIYIFQDKENKNTPPVGLKVGKNTEDIKELTEYIINQFAN